jgi:hypothetical protein
MLTRILIIAALLTLTQTSIVRAFEPGSERICTPSADGQTFECREKTPSSAGETTASAKSRAERVAPEPAAATVPANPAAKPVTASAPPAASKLPNYLLQSPRASRPTSANTTAAAPVADSSPTAPAEDPSPRQEPTASAATESSANVQPEAAASAQPETIENSPQSAPAAESSPAPAIEAPVASEDDEPAALPAPTVEEVAAEPATEPATVPEVAQPPAEIRAARPSLPGASAFLALPATHYTLVLASVRDPSALDALIESLDALPGPLFLIKLGMPDGDWYSLCWSDFADMDAARAARSTLPGDAAITSGWPRRIGPLQKEIAR